MTLKRKSVDKGLLLFLTFLFEVFNVRFLSNETTQLPENLNENFMEFKNSDKNFLVHLFEKVFCH